MPFSSVLFAMWQPNKVPAVSLIRSTADTTEFHACTENGLGNSMHPSEWRLIYCPNNIKYSKIVYF